MPALTDNFLKVAAAGSETTLASPGHSIGGTSWNIASDTGWPTTTALVFAVRQVDSSGNEVAGTYTEWLGTLSGTTLTTNSSPVYGSDQNYSAGATTQVFVPVSSYAHNLLIATLLQQHNQDGSHGAITSSGLTNAGALNQTGAISLAGSWDNWIGANESWSFLSATTITVPTDATTKYDIGDWVKLTQSATVKYFIVTGVATTVLTVAGLAGATVANSSITANAYSKGRNPHGNGLLGAIPYNPYKFFAYNNAVQNVANNTKLTFNTKVYDTGNNFDAVTNNYFTAPIAGFYFFGASIYVQSAGTFNINGTFMKNVSTPIARFGFTAVQGAGNDQQISGFVSAQLAANDTVQVNYLGSATRNVYGSSGDQVTCFTGYLVSAL